MSAFDCDFGPVGDYLSFGACGSKMVLLRITSKMGMVSFELLISTVSSHW